MKALTPALALLLFAPRPSRRRRSTTRSRSPMPCTTRRGIIVTFRGVAAGPLEVRMSRSSPGRYAIHEFAKNVYAVEATDGAGRRLEVSRPTPTAGPSPGHDGTVRFSLHPLRRPGRRHLQRDRRDATRT